MSKSRDKNAPDKDPYQVLGLTHTHTAHDHPTDVEITKAYRKLALKLHPDKQQQQNLSDAEGKLRAARFHDIQQARSFLLDEEHKSAREAYKTKRASQHVRKQADQAREKGMSERRKRMREELHKQEAAAAGRPTQTKSGASATDESSRKRGRSRKDTAEDDLVEKLRRQGQEMRDAYGDRAAAESVDRQTARDDKKRSASSKKPALDDRQVRLKWSRKRMRTSPSEHSLAKQLSEFGAVESVEMIGSKGNAALVTFTDAASVAPCVTAYQDSEEMRATFVGKRKEREEEREANADVPPPIRTERGRDGENVQDWKLRKAAERERLLRELEEEDVGQGASVETDDKSKKARKPSKGTSNPFPPPFPSTDDYQNLSSFGKLQHAESLLLKGIVSPERLLRSNVPVVTKQ
jgi:DnaJ family protein C protein 17